MSPFWTVSLSIGIILSGCSNRENYDEYERRYNEADAPKTQKGLFDWDTGVDGADLTGINFSGLEKMRTEYRTEYSKFDFIQWYIGICPPSRISINGKSIAFDNTIIVNQGSGSELYKSRDSKLLIKTIIQHISIYEGMAREKAILSVLDSMNGMTSRVFKPEISTMTKSCADRSIIFESVGTWSGYQLMIQQGLKFSESEIAKTAARMIEIIQTIHSFGIVHGDIHPGNFVFSSKTDISGTVKVIDFGRAIPFINPETKQHVKQFDVLKPDIGGFNPLFLSPFELEGSKLSRRDDMYRLAELLYIALGYKRVGIDMWGRLKALPQIASDKRKWMADSSPSHKIFTDFHHEMVNLGFTDRPDYEKWIKAFRSFP